MKKLTIVMLLFLTACASDKAMEYKMFDFPQQEELTYTTIVKGVPTRYAGDLTIVDSVLIVKGDDKESFFFAYNKNTGKHLKNFLKIGRGPFEGSAPTLIAVNGDSCTILESNTRRGWSFSLSGLLSERSNFYREFKFKLPEERSAMMINNAINLGNNEYIINVRFKEDERFAIVSNPYSIGEKSIKHIYKQYPRVALESDTINAPYLNHINSFALSPDRTKFVHLTLIGAIAETFEFKKDTLIPKAIKAFIKPEFNVLNHGMVTPKEGALMGFRPAIASNNYFYTIFHNNTYNASKSERIILAFDWNINPVKSYVLKDLVLSMTLDSVTNNVYAVVKNAETLEYDIVRFDKQFIE